MCVTEQLGNPNEILKPLRHQKKVLKLSPIVESTLKIQKNDTKYVLCLRSDERWIINSLLAAVRPFNYIRTENDVRQVNELLNVLEI